MNVRPFDAADHEEVMEWWKAQDWPPLPLNMLSKTGFLAEENGVKLAATWIFPTQCPIYIMEWTVGNPNVAWDLRSEALDQVTEVACQWAKHDGAKAVFTMTKNKRFLEKLEKNNFAVTDNGMTHLMRSL